MAGNYNVPGVAIGIVHEGRIAYTLNYGYVDKKTKKRCVMILCFRLVPYLKVLQRGESCIL